MKSNPSATPSLALLLLIPVGLWAFNAWITWKYAVDVPYWDSWEFVELVIGERPLTLQELASQANEHRIPIQKLFEVAWARISGWNQRAGAFLPMAFIFAGAVLYMRRALAERPALNAVQRTLLVLVLSLWLLTPRQSDFLLWEILLCWALLVLLLGAFDGAWRDFVDTGKRPWLVAALVVIGVASTGQSLAICLFLILAGFLAVLRVEGSTRRVLWTSAMAIVLTTIYFIGFVSPPHHPSTRAALADPVAAIKYCLIYAGAPFSATIGVAAFVGVGGATLLIASAVSLLSRKGAVWELVRSYPLLLIGLIVMFAVMVGRVGFGPDQAIASRYVPYSALMASSVLLLALDELARANRKLLTGALIVVLAVTVPLWYRTYRATLHDCWVRREGLVRWRDCRLGDPLASCDGSEVYPAPLILKLRADKLREHRLTMFGE